MLSVNNVSSIYLKLLINMVVLRFFILINHIYKKQYDLLNAT